MKIKEILFETLMQVPDEFWFNPETSQIIKVENYESHYQVMLKNWKAMHLPENEIIAVQNIKNNTKVINNIAFNNGWIRVDKEGKSTKSIEGTNIKNLRKTAQFLQNNDQQIEYMDIDNRCYSFNDEQLYLFIKYGTLPKN